MGLFDRFVGSDQENLDEALKPFERKESKIKPKDLENKYGEGIEDLSMVGSSFGVMGQNDIKSFNLFHERYIDQSFENEVSKMAEYRRIARYPEIGDVIEEAVTESTQYDISGRQLELEIIDDELANNENISKNIQKEFDDLFFNKIQINKKLEHMFTNYYVDGRVYWENIIDKTKQSRGILNIKVLPSETMDFSYNPITGKYNFFVQYLGTRTQCPATIKEAEKEGSMIPFNPAQITYLDYGQYGRNKKDVLGYLEKAMQPYNQIKLLETSVVIYRIVRAPERLVFTIDVGNMPRDKAMRYVNKVKQSMQKKVTYDPSSGSINNEPNVLAMLENFFLPQSADGRGSSIDSVGGNPSGFSELDDLFYFQRKMYKSLKYPASRVDSTQEKDNKSNVFAQSGEIARDETKWGTFLKKHQDKFAESFLDLFLLHLDFKKLLKEYDITKDKIRIKMTVPNNYVSQMQQVELDQRWNNYSQSDQEEFSKYYRMKKFLKMTDKEIRENAEGFKKDIELGFREADGEGGDDW